jgi:hypothetical protein
MVVALDVFQADRSAANSAAASLRLTASKMEEKSVILDTSNVSMGP